MRTLIAMGSTLVAGAIAAPLLAQSMPSISSVRSAASQAREVVDDVRYVAGDKAWATIGKKQVAAGSGTDKVTIDGDARYGKLRLCAVGHAVALQDFTVQFHNGTMQRFATAQTIEPDRCTPTTDMAGKARDIDAVDITLTAPAAGSEPELVVQAR